jgi:hypothetical protein
MVFIMNYVLTPKATFANDWVIGIPAAPTVGVALVEAHYDGFETASGVQLRPRVDVIGFETGFMGYKPVRELLLPAISNERRPRVL